MKERYLVTGCAGFIAWRVTELLLRSGHAVLGLDDLNNAYDVRLKRWRLDQLRGHEDFQFRQVDVGDPAALQRALDEEGQGAGRSSNTAPIVAVVHLAARAGVRASVEDPAIYYRTNCMGTLNVLETCRRHGISKFLLASTSSLYGQHNPVPYREDADTDKPLSPYAASKKAAETLAYTYHYLHGLDVSVVRYFTVYGPAGRPDMSVFRFIRRIAENEPIVVFGDGNQLRDFTYVDDIARGTVAALRPLGHEIINLGGNQPVALTVLIERISSLVGRPARIEHRPSHPADASRTWADITRAKSLFGWAPEFSLGEGLRLAVEWYRDHRDFARAIDLAE
jgi:UDP-glucuronate 4-epimerase